MSSNVITITADPEVLDAIRGLTQALKRFNTTVSTTQTEAPAAAVPPIPATTPAPAPATTPATTPAPKAPKAAKPAPAPAPEPSGEITGKEVEAICRQVVAAQRREDLIKLLGEFGAQSVKTLKPEQFSTFVEKAKAFLPAAG